MNENTVLFLAWGLGAWALGYGWGRQALQRKLAETAVMLHEVEKDRDAVVRAYGRKCQQNRPPIGRSEWAE